MHRNVLPFLEHAHEQATQAAIGIPVDPAQIVARHVGLEIGEIEPLPPRRAALFGQAAAFLGTGD
ncbi:hypothetical protein NRB_05040 [Novosphingobium sp. 11B]